MTVEDLVAADLRRLYVAYNERDIETVLAALHDEVLWPNAWEGGTITGRHEVREYWLRQWAAINPKVVPQRIWAEADGRYVVEAHQVVRDADGRMVSDRTVYHLYHRRGDVFDEMEIWEP